MHENAKGTRLTDYELQIDLKKKEEKNNTPWGIKPAENTSN